MTSERAAEIWRDQQAMQADRAPHEGRWRQLGELVWPASADWSGYLSPQPPSPDTAFDSTARRAAARFAALLVQVMTPSHERWHHLKPEGPAKRSYAARAYLEQVRDELFAQRYRARSGFGNAIFEGFLQLGCYGTGVIYVADRPGRGVVYRAIPLHEIYFGVDADGFVERVHRRYRLTARQAVGEFGGEALPQPIREAAEKAPETKFEFIHCVKPRLNRDPRRLDAMGMPIASYHLSVEGRVIVRESGYRGMPFMVFRYLGTPNSPWGLSAADLAFADVRMVNRMEKSQLNAANRAADPIWLASDDNLPPPRLVPNAINPGWLDPVTGRPLIQALESQARLDVGEAKLAQKRDAIESSFLGDFFRTLIENPNMKATQVLELASARAEQVAPFVERTQGELFGPLIERELEVLAGAGQLPPPPAELLRSGGEYKVEYDSPITRSLKAGEAVGIMRTIEAASMIEPLVPGTSLAIDGEAALRRIADAYGVPVEVLLPPEVVRRRRGEQQAQAEAAALVEAAPAVAGAAKDMASVDAARLVA